MKTIEDLILSRFLRFQKYSSARSEFCGTAKIFLDANENPFGENQENRYPSSTHDDLRNSIAEFYRIPSREWIALGNGSDEILDLLVRIFCTPEKDAILTTPPTFGMYSVVANLNAVQKIEVPLDENFEINADKILEKETKILFLCSPNNPTGNAISLEKIAFLCEQFKGTVIVDEAYSDFCPEKSAISLLEKYENLAVVKTFSKAWGLAGRRLGFLCASPKLISVFLAVKMPYNVNAFSAQSALQKLKNQEKYAQEKEIILAERKRLETFFQNHSSVEKVFPSDANFLLVRFFDAEEVFENLLANGIVVRNFSKKPFLEKCLRITVGSPQENDLLCSFLSK